MAKKKGKNSSKQIKQPSNPSETAKKKESILIAGVLVLVLIAGSLGIYFVTKMEIPEPSSSESNAEIVDRFKSYELNLSYHSPEVREAILNIFTNKETAEDIGSSSSLPELVYKVAKLVNPNATMKEINDFLAKCTNDIKGSRWGEAKVLFDELSTKEKLEAIASYLIRDKNFIYGSSILDLDANVKGSDGKTKVQEKKKGDTDPNPYTVDHLIKTGVGNCATLPIVYAMIAQRLGLNVKLVGIKDHMFARYEDGNTRINIETTSPKGMGVGTPDSFYLDLLKPSRRMLKKSSCMKTLSLRGTAGALFITQMAYLDKAKASKEDIKRAVAYSLYFNEKSEHAVMNSLQLFTNKDSTEDPLREKLLFEAQYLGVLASDPKTVQSMTVQMAGLQRQTGAMAKKIRGIHSQKMNAMLNMGQRTLENINKEQELYRRINSGKYSSSTHELLQELEKVRPGDIVAKQKANIELQHSLLKDIRYTRKKIEEFARNNDDNLSFEQVKIINQLLIQNGHNKAEVLRLDQT